MFGYFGDGQVGVVQQLASVFQSQLDQKLKKRFLGSVFKKTTKRIWSHIGEFRNRTKADFPLKIIDDKIENEL